MFHYVIPLSKFNNFDGGIFMSQFAIKSLTEQDIITFKQDLRKCNAEQLKLLLETSQKAIALINEEILMRR